MLGGLDTSMSECSALTPRINSGKPRHDTHRSSPEPVSGIVKGLVINAMVCVHVRPEALAQLSCRI